MPRSRRSPLPLLLLVALTAAAAAPPPATAPCNADAACVKRAPAASAAAKARLDSPQGANLRTGETAEEQVEPETTLHRFEDGESAVEGEGKAGRRILVAEQTAGANLRAENTKLKKSSAALQQRETLIPASPETVNISERRDASNAVLLSRKRVARAVTDEKHVAQSVGLHVAALGGRVEEMRQLIGQVADIGCGNKNGGTALHLAAINRLLEAMKVEIDSVRSLLPSITAPATASPTHSASTTTSTNSERTTVQTPRDDERMSDMLLEAARDGRFDEMRQLIGKGANIRYKNKQGVTVLHLVAGKCNVEALFFLLSRGANVDATTTDHGTTPLHWAAEKGHAQCAKALVAAGARINAPNHYGDTPLHYAASDNSEDTVRALLTLGADPGIRNKSGKTPRDHASSDAVRALFPA